MKCSYQHPSKAENVLLGIIAENHRHYVLLKALAVMSPHSYLNVNGSNSQKHSQSSYSALKWPETNVQFVGLAGRPCQW